MQTMSDVLPLSHVVGGIRQAWLGQTDDPHALWWPFLVSAVSRGDRRSRSARRNASSTRHEDESAGGDGGAEAVDDLGVVELLGHPHRVDDRPWPTTSRG